MASEPSELETAKKAAQEAQLGNKDPARFPAWPRAESLIERASSTDAYADDMYVKLLCHPPLGQPTVVPAGSALQFRVLLEADARNACDWDVELWYGAAGHEWRAAAMQYGGDEGAAQKTLFTVDGAEARPKKHVFCLTLERPETIDGHTEFTVRYRRDKTAGWRWYNDQFSLGNGSIYWQDDSKPSKEFDHYISGTDSDISVREELAQTSDTLLWSLSCPVEPADQTKSSFKSYKLGLATNFTRWFATCRLMTVWLRPRHGKHKFHIENQKALSVAFLRHDGLSVVALALSGIDDTSVLLHEDAAGNVMAEVRNDGDKAGAGKILVAVANSFDVANAAVMYHARRMSHTAQLPTAGLASDLQSLSVHEPEAKWMEEWYDGFGYCTWNSLGQQLSEKLILEALEDFKKDGITLTSLIIDDNWQSLDNEGQEQGRRGMTRFEADAKAFPKGLKDLVTTIKGFNPKLKRVAVWHTILGYWGAISPDGELAQKYKTVKALNNNGWDWTSIAGEDILRFYNDFYKFLDDCGVDGVKTDSQNSLDDLQNATDRHSMIKEYQDAWTIAGLRHLSARQISCGSQCPVIMFHSLIKTNLPRLVVRNSDDFFPNNPGSHPWHIFCNAHNSLMTQHLNILPDWDMFQTDHEWAYYHAAARCLSGGPIYITDYPSKHDKALIAQMTAKTVSGTTVILRPQRLGKASHAYISYDEPRLLKIDTYNGPAQTGTSIVGVFNVSQVPLSELIALSDFPGTEEGEYIIRSHNLGRTTQPMRRADEHAVLQVDLDVKGYDIFTAYPVRTVETTSRAVRFANLGLVGKMSGAAAIVSEQVYSAGQDNGAPVARLWTSLKALGTWGVWIEDLPSLSKQDDLFALMAGKPVDGVCVKYAALDRNVLEIDLTRAWEMNDGQQSWGNEVVVQLFVR